MCDRVIIISKGTIVANKPTAELKQSYSNQAIVTVEFNGITTRSALTAIEGVSDAKNSSGNTWQITAIGDKDIRTDLFNFAVKNNLAVLTIHKEEQKLEDIFKELAK